MDILLQYLNIRRQRQEFIRIVEVPCNSIHRSFNLNMVDKAISFIDYMEQCYKSNYLLTGIIDAKYCNRQSRAVFSYVDFCQLTCGPGETSGID